MMWACGFGPLVVVELAPIQQVEDRIFGSQFAWKGIGVCTESLTENYDDENNIEVLTVFSMCLVLQAL